MTQASARERLEEGERLFSEGELGKAREIFESLLHEEAASMEALNNLGVIAHQQGDREMAFHYFVKALHVDPHYQEAIENLCHLHEEWGRYPKPVEGFRTPNTRRTLTAIDTAFESIHHLDPNVRLVTNRKDYLVDHCRSRSVLHIGCVGSGSIEERLKDGSHLHQRISRVSSSLVGIDINAEGIAAMKSAGFKDCLVKDIERDGVDLELIKNIEIILVPEVLEHLSNPGHFLDRLKALNYPGEVLVSVPNAFSYRSVSYLKELKIEFVHPDHHFYFSPTTLRTLIEKHGFLLTDYALYYWPSNDEFGKKFESVLKQHPYLAEGIIAVIKDRRTIARSEIQLKGGWAAKGCCNLAGQGKSIHQPLLRQGSSTPFKLYYSPGIAHHGEKMRRMLKLDHYIPSIHTKDPVWFFGLYFDQDYLQMMAHQGDKVINWRGSDSLQLKNAPARIQMVKNVRALHVCQSHRQQAALAEFGLRSIVRPMINEFPSNIAVSPFPRDRTRILVFWKRGIDDFISADLFFEVALKSLDVEFHIVGDEDPHRFTGAGMENLVHHGFLSERDLDDLMDLCKGTLRPWVSDGTPNIQTKMLLKGRYAAHSCRFERVAHCRSADDYVAWIDWLRGVTEPNLEAREWWLSHLNNFDFLEPGFDPGILGAGEGA